jgi:hypothetical protein
MADSTIAGLTSWTPTTDDLIIFYDNADGVTKKSAISSIPSSGGGITIGTTAITSGTSGRILYDNAGVVGELATNGTGNVSLTTSPTFVTPILGAATATSINGATITSGTLNGGTNTGDETTGRINTLYGTTNAITVGSVEVWNATDTTISRVSAGVIAVEWVTVPTISSTSTLTNKRVTSRIGTEASSATSTPTADTVDQWNVTALAAADTFAAPTGTPTDGQTLIIRIKDNWTARVLAWNAIYRASSDLALPLTTVISKTLYLWFRYNAADSKWDLLALLNNV